ncbi:putative toxin-antitoxin system toxin component, PIN family [Thermococcus peptonophilus]|uniref:putative toxin-antitoxin system toxin component, PIN family n=1 Tax=Thermococcus peptonophilus TaxID=53952 RepID=UPI000AEAC759|nr:putative toxin-antitoxin system toxin component, PIN family [Thermococcus peptonophilus]
MGVQERIRAGVILDTNVIISALIPKNSKLRGFLLTTEIPLHAPDYMLRELEKYWRVIEKKAKKRGITEPELAHFREELLGRIIFHPLSEYRGFINEAYRICREFDERDTPFVALALSLRLPIVTNDKDLLAHAGEYEAIPLNDVLR